MPRFWRRWPTVSESVAVNLPAAIVYGEFWHSPNRAGAGRQCSGCRQRKFRHGYDPFPHAHWMGGQGGHYAVCRGGNCGAPSD